ncbi:serine--tRNA ligase [Rickettsiales endosymbiont of Peranema trichophorum]|uniref:serine--tRNA ligase n=1 Tax=Rickettsiales endosymbiont of Peranema trichophorum TaxID=2486577 RepID=UPI0010238BD2|nr:serine--tRNA ligase [Rickettsiales endosymbiont of Peranema trichophorum]RZI45633.1 serine--tRNA ligase [Rickettsiales endosymbiont of Peranema trichophorum]
MHDIKWIRQNKEYFEGCMAKRGIFNISERLLELDRDLREHETKLQQHQSKMNDIAKEIGLQKGRSLREIRSLMEDAERVKKEIALLEVQTNKKHAEFQEFMSSIPNIPDEDVPHGIDEASNIEINKHGAPRNFEFEPLHHYELGEYLQQMNFDLGAKVSGSRFVMLFDQLSMMERALANFMLDIHTREFGYTEVTPPLLVKNEAMFGVGQLPKFDIDSFLTREGLRLIPTAEVPLTNIVSDTILEEHKLPLRYTAYSQCFRSEAGSAGRDTRGMIRNHQFSKVELVSITNATDSKTEHERMLHCAETILQRLEIPYRVMLLCGGDLGFSSSKTYDIEVWLPAQKCYREISSCSNCLDFQARRMKARYKDLRTGKNRMVHTLNGSGLAIGRTIIAILENYQNSDHTVSIPTTLQRYMNGISTLSRNS